MLMMLISEKSAQMDYNSAMASSHAEGREEGILFKGVQVYDNCISRGMSEEEAYEIAGITEEDLAKARD